LTSRQDLVRGFAVCVFLIFSWSIVLFLKKIPYWRLFLSTWEIASALAYALAFALLESIAVFLVWVLLSILLPAPFLRANFVALGSIVLIISATWIIADHLRIISLSSSLLWPLLYLASIGLLYPLVYRGQGIARLLDSIAERLTVLLYVYLPAALLGLVIVILRNLWTE